MKYVNFLFHIYQPPTQDLDILAKIIDQSYAPLTRQIKAHDDLRFTLNINYSLVEQLNETSSPVLENIRAALERGTLELTATGAYHPIFPLVPMEEVKRQIKLNHTGNQRLLSRSFNPTGVFPPELAFTGRLASLFKSMNYQWTIADDGSLDYYGIEVPYNKIYCSDGIAVFLRSNHWANKFADYSGQWSRAADFVSELERSMQAWMGDSEGYLIIALDGETFGHHHSILNEEFLGDLFQSLRAVRQRLETAHLSDLLARFPTQEQFVPPGSWSTDLADVRNRDYFAWWSSERNSIHQLQWEFTNQVLKKVRRLAANRKLNEEMDKALYSCQFWWASYWKFNPSEIYRGAFNTMRLLQMASSLDGNDEDLLAGEETFKKLVTEVEKTRRQRGT